MQRYGRVLRLKDVSTTTSETSELDVAAFASDEGPALMRYAYLLTGRTEDAEDLVQSVLLQLSRDPRRAITSPKAYARRAILNLHRSLGRRSVAHVRALVRSGAHVDVERVDDDTETLAQRDALWKALDVLSARQRAAVVLRYFEDCSDETIAEVLGCAVGTARSLVSRSLPRLRDHLFTDAFASSKGGSDA